MSGLERLYSPPEIGAPGKRKARTMRRDLTLAGLLVLGMAALAVATFMYLGSWLFGNVYHLRAYFANASGLHTSTQVIQDGYVIGAVERMTAIIPGRHEGVENCPPPQENEKEEPKQERKGAPQPPCFRVTLRIQGEWPIPKDSTATLGSAGLLQGDAIMIQPGSAPALLEDGQKIETTPRDGGLMAQLKDLTRTLHDLVDNTIEPALANIRDQIQTIKDLLGTGGDNAENRDRLAGVFQNLEQLSADMESAVNPAQIQSILSSVQQVSANLELVSATFTERSGDIKRTVRSYGDLATDISSLVKETKPSVQRSLDDTQFLLQEISASLVPILTNIEDATRNLSIFSRDLRSNPAVIIKGREVEEETPWFK